MKKQTLKFKNYILLSIIVLSQLHVYFRGDNTRVDWYLLIEYTRRIDYAVMYLCKHIIYVIYAYVILFPIGVKKDIKVFIFMLSIADLLHYVLISHIGFSEIKIVVTLVAFALYKIIRK